MKDRIKEIRKEFNLTQSEFAEKLGVKQGTIASYEGGYREPIAPIIKTICDTFGVNEEWFKNGTGEKYASLQRNDEIAEIVNNLMKGKDNDFEIKLIKMLTQLNVTEWKRIEVFLTRLIEE